MNVRKLMWSLVACLAVAGGAMAQERGEGGPPRGERSPQMEAAMKECFKQQGLQAPQRGERPAEMSDGVRAKISACMEAKGFKRPSGQRPER